MGEQQVGKGDFPHKIDLYRGTAPPPEISERGATNGKSFHKWPEDARPLKTNIPSQFKIKSSACPIVTPPLHLQLCAYKLIKTNTILIRDRPNPLQKM